MATVTTWAEFEDLAAQVQYVRGAAIKNPTDLSLPFPYGGTVLGLWGSVEEEFEEVTAHIPAEEYGGHLVEGIENAVQVRVSAMLRSFDRDGLAAVLPGVTLDATSGDVAIDLSATSRRGGRATDRAIRLLFVPRFVERQAAVYLPAAVGNPRATATAALEGGTAWGLPVVFQAYPDASLRTYIRRRLEVITL